MLTTVDLFEVLPTISAPSARRGTTLSHRPGQVVVRQGSPEPGPQLVVEGSSEVSVDGVAGTTMTPGAHFAEISLPDHQPRSATVTAGPDGLTRCRRNRESRWQDQAPGPSVFGKSCDALITEGQKLNPTHARTGTRGCPALGPAGSLLARLQTHRADVLRFATDFTVPFDNNRAERDVRMVKFQQKISGGWRSENGARASTSRPIGTVRKCGQSAMTVLRDLFTDQV